MELAAGLPPGFSRVAETVGRCSEECRIQAAHLMLELGHMGVNSLIPGCSGYPGLFMYMQGQETATRWAGAFLPR